MNIETDNSVRKRNQSSQAADHVVVNYSAEEPDHILRTNDHEVSLPQSSAEEATPEDREQRQYHSQKSQ